MPAINETKQQMQIKQHAQTQKNCSNFSTHCLKLLIRPGQKDTNEDKWSQNGALITR